MKVGVTSFPEAQHIANNSGAVASDTCTPDDCTWTRQIDNSLLPSFWRGTKEAFIAGFTIKKSVLAADGFMYRIGTGMDAPFVKVEEQTEWRELKHSDVVGVQSNTKMQYWRVNAKLTPKTSPDLKGRLLKVNFNCLDQWQGCRDAADLLPGIDKLHPSY